MSNQKIVDTLETVTPRAGLDCWSFNDCELYLRQQSKTHKDHENLKLTFERDSSGKAVAKLFGDRKETQNKESK